MKLLPKLPLRGWLVVSLFALIISWVGGYYALRTYVRPAVKNWRVERFNQSARDFLTKGDAANALLLARRSLQSTRDKPEAWQIAAFAAKKLGRPDAIFYQDTLSRLLPTKENYLELLRLAVHFGRDGFALDVIKRAAGVAVNEPEYYKLAAQVFLRQGRVVAAKYYLIALTTLSPADSAAQLDLAAIEISEDPTRKDAPLRARVRTLAEIPDLRRRALSLLLDDSLKANLKVESDELSRRLQAVPDLDFDARLLLIRASMLCQPDRTTEMLTALQTESVTRPNDVSRIVDFMVANDRANQVLVWYRSLGPDVTGAEPVKRAVAEALFALHDWEGLRTLVKEGSWPTREYLKRALLAYSYKIQGRTADFDETWKGAVLEAGKNVPDSIDLLRRIETWRWKRERYDVLWKLFTLIPQNQGVRQELLVWERRQGNTANLNRIFARTVELDPSDKLARNNFAYASLLLDANLTQAGLIARELVAADPNEPFFTTTLAFSLYKEGKYAEALRVLESLRESALSQPERILLHALILCRTGDYVRAEDLISKCVRKGLLPEERRLAETVELDIVRNTRSQKNSSRLVAIRETRQAGGESSGWLAIVAPQTRAMATVDMQLADSLYGAADLKALLDVLRSAQWGELNYLRHALIAYCRLADSPGAARDAWQQALALAQRNNNALENLQNLVTRWDWPTERIEVLNQLHVNSPGDRGRLHELLSYYRQGRRTSDLIRVLRLYVETVPTTSEAVAYTYYSLLSNIDTVQATVRAKSAFEAEPDSAERRLVYAFSLWRQKRGPEAQVILKNVPVVPSDVIPGSLVRAVVDAELGRIDEAQEHLKQFDREKALPEELELAKKVALRLAERK